MKQDQEHGYRNLGMCDWLLDLRYGQLQFHLQKRHHYHRTLQCRLEPQHIFYQLLGDL
jgi:hypothetical protein